MLSKKVLKLSLATALLSLGANAMQSQNQSQCQQSQCGRDVNLTKPPVACGGETCVQLKNQVTFELKSGTTINKKEWTTIECLLVQPFTDCDDSVQHFPVKKIAPDMGQCDQSQQQRNHEMQCGSMEITPVARTMEVDYSGTKTGNVTYVHFTEEELTFNGGDSVLISKPCEKITAQNFTRHLHGDARNFSMDEVQNALQGLLHELESGPVVIEKGPVNVGKASKSHSKKK